VRRVLVLDRLGKPRVQQHLTVRAEALLVETLDHAGVDLAVQAQGSGALARPLAGRLTGGGVVRHRPDAPAGA